MMPALLSVAALLGAEPKWEQVAQDDGVTVYSRELEGARIREMKSIGLVDAAPATVWALIRDYEHMSENLPYTEDAKVLERIDGGKITIFYAVTNLPIVSRRDYIIKLLDESEGDTLKVTWTEVDDARAPPRDGHVRVALTRGAWILEPRENGTKTFMTYRMQLDPGGSIPTWVANRANRVAVPEVFRAVRAASKKSAKN